MGSTSDRIGISLCCCEFEDDEGERRHLLELCCNCVVLDDACSRCITCKPVADSTFLKLYNELAERLRIPFCDGRGSRKLVPPLNFLLSLFYTKYAIPVFLMVPCLLIMAARNFISTLLMVSMIHTFNWLFYRNVEKKLKKCVTPQYSNLVFIGIISSILTVYLTFEYVVVPFLEIQYFENVIVMVLLSCGFVPLYVMKVEGEWLKVSKMQSVMKPEMCCICKFFSNKEYKHSIWLDVCLDKSNERYYVISSFMLFVGLIYGTILSLTTVCFNKYYFYESILLPYNCSDVYSDMYIGLAFSCVIYSLSFAAIILWKLLKRAYLLYKLHTPAREKPFVKFSRKFEDV